MCWPGYGHCGQHSQVEKQTVVLRRSPDEPAASRWRLRPLGCSRISETRRCLVGPGAAGFTARALDDVDGEEQQIAGDEHREQDPEHLYRRHLPLSHVTPWPK